MLEEYAAILVQKFLGNYVRGINKEALKISAWQGDVELKNMQLKPEALNALKLPVKVKAGFLGSVKLKVPWSRLGQEPVVVYLDRIFILAEPALQVEGSSEEALQEAKRNRVKEMEIKLMEARDELKSDDTNTSWLGSVINTIVGNLKLSVSNIHIRYEDAESNLGHPFAAGLTLGKLSAVTVDDQGNETFATGVNLDRIQKSLVLESLAFYFDSDSNQWEVGKPWEDLLPSEWSQIFEFGEKDASTSEKISSKHSYVLHPVTGSAKYTKLRLLEARRTNQALQKAAVDLDDVTLSLSKDGYRDIILMADNFSAFNQRLKYAHYRPSLPVKSDPKSWWKYAYRLVTEETKKASGRLAWDQVLRYSKLRKKYVSLYASLLKADPSRMVVDDNEEIQKLDRQLDTEIIIQWRMLAHKFVEESIKGKINSSKQKAKQSWWPFGSGSTKEEPELKGLTDEDREKLNKIIGYNKENTDELVLSIQDKNLIQFSVKVRMKHNASRLTHGDDCLADLSCDELLCDLQMYPETKIFDLKLGSYKLSSPYGLLAKSATVSDSFGGVFCYKPFMESIDWSFTAKAKPCYVTYLKESVDLMVNFFKSSPTISQTLVMEAAAAVQTTIDEVKKTAQQQVTRALKEKARFSLDLDIAAPKITIPSKFCPDGIHETKLLLDLGNLILRTQEMWDYESEEEEKDMYLQFNLDLSDVSAFLVDGEYQWSLSAVEKGYNQSGRNMLLPVIDKCGIVVKLQQIQLENPQYPSTRLAIRLPSLGFHFSPARYHRLMAILKFFQGDNTGTEQSISQLQDQTNFEGWLSILSWKGVGNREPVWQRRYLRLVGSFLYIFESPTSPVYKQWISLRGKQVRGVNGELAGGVANILALYDSGQFNPKVLEDGNALILLAETDEVRRTWHKQLQGAIYRASGAPSIATISEAPSPDGSTSGNSFESDNMINGGTIEKLFLAGVLDELKVSFSSSYENKQDFKKILLSNERSLFMFRAVGGQVELSMKAGNILIGTILRSLEIEDQYSLSEASTSMSRYLARSFINNSDDISMHDTSPPSSSSLEKARSRNSMRKTESDENFFEATDDFDEVYETPHPDEHQTTGEFSLKPPGFSRIPGLIPNLDSESGEEKVDKNNEDSDSSSSFIKAQIVVYDQSSPQYKNLDNRVIVTLATLSFFCHRPTIVAIMEFANAINYVEAKENESVNESDNLSGPITEEPETEENSSSGVQDPAIRGLLVKGKSRVIFHLTLNMAKAAIYLMRETGDSIATLSQNNLLTDIKVFPSSFSIKAALGNLKISDDSLKKTHPYYWVCDMRNPEGTSFIEVDFTSFSVDDEDYCGFDYSLTGELSEVRIVYLNRFVQEIIGYFMGLVPRNVDNIVKLKDNATNSETWINKSEIEGSPAFKLDLSLCRPIILMPRSTNSLDFLELDVVTITVGNTFQWLGGDKNDINAVHLDLMTIKVKDINLRIGINMVHGESIIQDVHGLSVEIRRSLRDLNHLMPAVEATIKMELLKASLSNREYEIITECALSNFSEAPNIVPSLYDEIPTTSSTDVITSSPTVPSEALINGRANQEDEVVPWTTIKCSVSVKLIGLSLHSGLSRDSPLATLEATEAWLLYKSNTLGQGFLYATLKGFSILDDREGTREEFRLAIGKSMNVNSSSSPEIGSYGEPVPGQVSRENIFQKQFGFEPTPPMLILDATFRRDSTDISLCIQRPKFLVVLDFLVAIVEFFVPSSGAALSNEDDKDKQQVVPAIIFVDQIYTQDCSVLSISPKKPLVADDEGFSHFIYDGKGGKLILQDSNGELLSGPSPETFIFVGSGKSLKFRNVTIMDGEYLDSCISLGSDSSYSASEADGVFLEIVQRDAELSADVDRKDTTVRQSNASTEVTVQLQAIGPELTFFSSSKNISERSPLSTKVIHANTDAFCRIAMKGDNMDIRGDVLGLKMESNGIRVLEPFDASLKYSSTSGRTNMNLSFSEIYMNFSFSILRLFLAVQDDILSFMQTSSKRATELCSQFDNVASIHGHGNDRVYAFWRPRAPSGFAVLGDCLTPLNEPPAKAVVALNTSLVRVKRPVAYKLLWQDRSSVGEDNGCSIWFPVAPKGYVAVGCVASTGSREPPLSSALCLLASYVSATALKDCILLSANGSSNMAFWRVDNCFGSFILGNKENPYLVGKAYDLRHMLFKKSSNPSSSASGAGYQSSHRVGNGAQIEGDASSSSGRFLEAIESPKLVWSNNGTSSRKRLSIWRPDVPPGMVFFGDIALNGYEQPNSAIVFRDTGDETLLRPPVSFQFVSRIKKQRGIDGISFWYPEPPPGYTSLGCIASKTVPKPEDFPFLRCIRSDMLTSGNFPEESVWDSSDAKVSEPFSLWSVEGDSLGTFIVRNGIRKPQRRLAHKLLGPPTSSGSDSMVIQAELKSISAAAFDDYGGLMMPLFGVSLDDIGFSLHGGSDYLNATASFSLVARSFNDKCDSWEPLIEPTDGFLRYQYDMNTPGTPTQLRMTSTRDLSLNVSVSNVNMIFQAYSSWYNLSRVDNTYKQTEVYSPVIGEKRAVDVHHRRNSYIVPQNYLGQDIYIRVADLRGLPSIIKLPSGGANPIRVPIPKNSMHSHPKQKHHEVSRSMITVVVAEAEIEVPKELSISEYMAVVQLYSSHSSETPAQKQIARTCAAVAKHSSEGLATISWKEMFFFKVFGTDDYSLEIAVTDLGIGETVGFFSSPLKDLVSDLSAMDSLGSNFEITWRDLSTKLHDNDNAPTVKNHARIKFAVMRSGRQKTQQRLDTPPQSISTISGLQLGPSKDGPWTTVKLNYAMPSTCWRFGNDVIASEMTIRDNDRYVTVRSLVSVTNSTDFVIEVRLKGKIVDSGGLGVDDVRVESDDFIQSQKYSPASGWTDDQHEDQQSVELPSGWQWMDDWHLETGSGSRDDGWIYTEGKDNRRQRRWIRHRKLNPLDRYHYVSVGELRPGATIPLPLPSLTDPTLSYALEIRPISVDDVMNYAWSIVKEGSENESDEICVSNLIESDKLLFSSLVNGSPSSSEGSSSVWFCVSIDAKEIGKDILSDPIHDWNIAVKPPLSLSYYLPFSSQYSVVVGNELNSENEICLNDGTIAPGTTVKIHNAGPNDPLYLSLLPQGGWEPLHEPVIISHPTKASSKLINLRNAFSQRIVQITLEHNYDKDCPVSKVIRIYVPYWISCARLPRLSLCVSDISGKEKSRFPRMSQSAKRNEKNLWKITPDEMVDGYTIASVLDFKGLGMSASVVTQGQESFGPVKELTPLSDMDGSIDLLARDADGNCVKILVSSKPCSFQAVPTKAIMLRPFMTFINMVGQDVFLKINDGEQPQKLFASDWKVSFPYSENGAGPDVFQVRLSNTNWSYPVQISKEDSIILVMRKADGGKEFLRSEVRAYEEGSRFLIVFRLGPAEGPIRIENRTRSKTIQVQQSGLEEEAWIYLDPRTTKKYCFENPYGRKVLEVGVHSGENRSIHFINLEKPSETSVNLREKHGIQLHIIDVGDIKVVKFMDESSETQMGVNDFLITTQKELRSTSTQFEVIVELGVVGVSLIDHRPKELLYLHLQRVFISYLTGTVSRFKLLIGHLQLDNELPLTIMPVLLAPEEAPDLNHPVFKSNIAIRNETADGTEVYPFVYLRVTKSLWRLNVHEPIIWALVDFYRNLRIDSMPSSSSVTQVDPEIRIEVIDISEVRLKISLETAPTQRPRGVLGIWSPIFSAVGSALKIQVHLRKVGQENKYMKKSQVLTAITNRIKRDLVHNPLHLIFSLDVLSMTKSALASLSKGFAELSTDGQFVRLRSQQVSSRKITGVGDGLVQGTEAFAQGVAFGVSGVLTKPVESVRQYGLLGFAHGLGRAFIGFIVQPLSGLLDFGSLAVDGIGASFIRCLEILNNKSVVQRIRNPRAIHADGVVREYSHREASGQMVLYLAEASRHLACTDLFREPSKYAWSDYYEDHFIVPLQRIVLVTNKRVMLLQSHDLDKMDKRPSKILWDVPWEEVLSLELAKRGHPKPSMLIIHLKNCTKSGNFSRYIRCKVEEENNQEPQAVMICCTIRSLWKSYQANTRVVLLKVPSSRRHVRFVSDDFDGRESNHVSRPMVKLKRSPSPDDRRFLKHVVNFQKIWSSERQIHSRCTLFKKQVADVSSICSIWRPFCDNGYVSVGDIVHVGTHAPSVAAVYRNSDQNFALPIGFDLVWRNCEEDYNAPLTIWLPRAPDGYTAIGCVAVAAFEEPAPDSVYCVSARLTEETSFVEQPVWAAPDSFPWSCYLYQVQSEALQFVALRLRKEELNWRALRVSDQLAGSSST